MSVADQCLRYYNEIILDTQEIWILPKPIFGFGPN